VWSYGSSDCTLESNSTLYKYYLYIFHSNIYQNGASASGGMAIDLTQICFAIHIVVDNVLFSRSTASSYSGGNIGIAQMCTVGNSVTVSRSIVEFGNASDAGGGMAFITTACKFPIVGYKPTTLNILGSTFQYNTAYTGGGLVVSFNSSLHSCCSAKVNIVDVAFLNNGATKMVEDTEESLGGGGNIRIMDIGGQWLNNTVRIENCRIQGGMAALGGGIYVTQLINSAGSTWNEIPTVEVLFISNTQFVCNQAATDDGGASLRVETGMLNLNSTIPAMTKKLTIMNTKFEGTCSVSSNVEFVGTSGYVPHVLINYMLWCLSMFLSKGIPQTLPHFFHSS